MCTFDSQHPTRLDQVTGLWPEEAAGSLLTSVLCVNLVRVDRSGDIVFLHHNPIEIDESFGNHIKPFVRESLGLFLESIPQKSSPS